MLKNPSFQILLGIAFVLPACEGFVCSQERIKAIELAVRPTETQRPALDELKAASAKAAEVVASACPRELPASPTARLGWLTWKLSATRGLATAEKT